MENPLVKRKTHYPFHVWLFQLCFYAFSIIFMKYWIFKIICCVCCVCCVILIYLVGVSLEIDNVIPVW